MNIADHHQRQKALDPNHSFIVQAPAGSGKTELLTKRFLVLLARVDRAPEEIIAITFTRKAASEMRARIINALKLARSETPPSAPHTRETWELARRALARDEKEGWDIIHSPSRLRILTIDAMCASLTRQMPILSSFGASPEIAMDARPYYQSAARELLLNLDDESPWTKALETLLLHLNNDLNKVESLFMAMLARRDQWLPYIAGISDTAVLREKLEATLLHIIQENLRNINIPEEFDHELHQLMQFAFKNLIFLPEDELDTWKQIAAILLTQKFQFRKCVNKNQGFPVPPKGIEKEEKAHYKHAKERVNIMLTTFGENETLRQSLEDVLLSPPPHYSEQQWEVVEALITILPVLAAQLVVTFRQHSKVDFIEVSNSALKALGDTDKPTDLALRLDYKIQHLLVDEFQDTSATQYKLLELLTAGWIDGDGRTLFLVGDPMQSIYRFRQAEVGLFLKARQEGIGAIKLQPLNLEVNFRSEAGVIDWINNSFEKVFPSIENISQGAVSFSPSTSIHDTTKAKSVCFHPLKASDGLSNAAKTIEIIMNAEPDEKIAILVRARSHLLKILPALKAENIKYQAVEIETLGNSTVVTDLWSLTRALLYFNDRIAWLSILRAPWCGLMLSDLHVIANTADDTIWEALCNDSALPVETKNRIARLMEVLKPMIENRMRHSLRKTVETVWHALGGPACLDDESELADAAAYFELLQNAEVAGDLPDIFAFEKKLFEETIASQNDSNANVQIMTIHKSKGLEFDTVIIPGLEKRAAANTHPLMIWMERPRQDNDFDLLLAPIKSFADDHDPIFQYLHREDGKKHDQEIKRLLYVAATRAKKQLHLLAEIKQNDEGELVAPNSSSILSHLWECVDKESIEICADTVDTSLSESHLLNRLPSDWRSNSKIAYEPSTNPHSVFSWQTENNRHIGTVTHLILKQIATLGVNKWKEIDQETHRQYWQDLLSGTGLSDTDIQNALDEIQTAITVTIQDEKGQWILEQHHEAGSEYAISSHDHGTLILDRTFVDQDGIRWIIDYKMSEKTEGALDAFLEQEKAHHTDQLEKYRMAMAGMEQRPIKCGLYFPRYAAWVETH